MVANISTLADSIAREVERIAVANRDERAWCHAYLTELARCGALSRSAVERIWRTVYGEEMRVRDR
jgi:hypothetical protein